MLPASMPSLPTSTYPTRNGRAPCATAFARGIGIEEQEDERSLVRAFQSFAAASSSLEHSYGRLQRDVERLRGELESKNRELKRSLEENLAMRAHLHSILQSLPCGVIVVAADGTLSTVNRAAVELLGRGCLATGGTLADVPVVIRDLIDRARSETEPEVRITEADGTERWLSARHAAAGDAGAVFILRDISVQKRLEDTQEKLRRDQLLAEISALLAHEIRNPLGSMELFTGLLADTPLSPECHQWVEHLQAGLRTLAATVNNVLSFHSLPECERRPIELGELLQSTRAFLNPLARQNNVTLSVQNHLSGVYVAADPHRLQQVLLNLVLNSVRVMHEGGWIEIGGSVAATKRAAEVVVADTGPGIPPEHSARIFEAGFTTRSGSPGLGLAVCRKIMEQHGGTIRAESRPGQGARFTITLPVVSCKVREGAA
jgi:two-component system, sensor histidine kinase FlrB